ncbi:hypothetical protein JIG36_36065 [Actinoplanes sp. LDG1-06]|uniref:Uncharacterized protein n=1 Tax=Paractinoplanes ovalisporus TaxID=2810368 RepID=A0ABS2AMA6_9ACTN|nr:hypothetical protein [Actinoplanes ovalisporus]MBM2620930.1 hypothetical protein [Actinoplanes ovalisporus]
MEPETMTDEVDQRKAVEDDDISRQETRREFVHGPWFPLVCVLLVVTVVVVSMLVAGSASGVPGALAALATVIGAVGGLIAATRSRRR